MTGLLPYMSTRKQAYLRYVSPLSPFRSLPVNICISFFYFFTISSFVKTHCGIITFGTEIEEWHYPLSKVSYNLLLCCYNSLIIIVYSYVKLVNPNHTCCLTLLCLAVSNLVTTLYTLQYVDNTQIICASRASDLYPCHSQLSNPGSRFLHLHEGANPVHFTFLS